MADGYEEEDGNARRNSLARDSRPCVVVVKGKFPGVGVQGKNRASMETSQGRKCVPKKGTVKQVQFRGPTLGVKRRVAANRMGLPAEVTHLH